MRLSGLLDDFPRSSTVELKAEVALTAGSIDVTPSGPEQEALHFGVVTPTLSTQA